MKRERIAVIILNWNGVQDTLECLDSVSKSRIHLPLSIYLVDNASTDNSVSIISTKFPLVTLLQNSTNLGYAGGNNVGIRQALKDQASHIILLNNDTTIASDAIQRLIVDARKHHFALASPKIYFYPGREFHTQSYKNSEQGKIIWYAGGYNDWHNLIPHHLGVNEFDHGQFDQITSTEFATGCCLYIQAEVCKAIGFLDENYTAYFEDNDFCMRAKKHGFSIGFIPSAFVWHKNASSSGGSGSKGQVKIVDQSRLRFGLRYAPLRAKLALLKNTYLRHPQ